MNNYNPLYHDIFDSHAHYDDQRFDEEREELLAALPGFGVCAVIDVGCDRNTSFAAAGLAKKYPYIYAAVGYHPHEAKSFTLEDWRSIEPLLSDEKIVAVGEIGLDYYYDSSPREAQQGVFDFLLSYAYENHLPVIIHSREATQDTLTLLKKYPGLTGTVHCFSGSAETAKELLKMGYYIGFTGVVTFKNASRIVEACKAVPLDRLLLETDCPYMAPIPYRRTRSDSTMISQTAETIAALHNVSPQEVIDRARENTCRLFGIALK